MKMIRGITINNIRKNAIMPGVFMNFRIAAESDIKRKTAASPRARRTKSTTLPCSGYRSLVYSSEISFTDLGISHMIKHMISRIDALSKRPTLIKL